MAAARKTAAEEQPEVVEAPEVIQAPEPVRQPEYLADNRNRLAPERIDEVRKEEGIAPQHRLIEHTRNGVIKGS